MKLCVESFFTDDDGTTSHSVAGHRPSTPRSHHLLYSTALRHHRMCQLRWSRPHTPSQWFLVGGEPPGRRVMKQVRTARMVEVALGVREAFLSSYGVTLSFFSFLFHISPV